MTSSYHRRFLQEEGVITCPHCEQDFEDWTIVSETLQLPVLDDDGYCRDIDPHIYLDCPQCGKIVVFGCDAAEGFMPFVVRGRSPADVRFLELKEQENRR